ncbi:hypothetical protein MELA_01913 [Candidatus Methylomirabilis lanthanidiphila]|uniref:Lipoprotein n=1 Tax=Candidatus Methylomirabilis lanthanidiphila TaxID=2211376 RepID=A0A564ZLU1_9BACT|nr:hypothetical protein [Candidatus Methylomirabilis lanthanidiphila]VUZ85528.1 hypothetical protein MELA_01913 [Candidatus Methylomirabilis lanthanidiphila]
MTRAAGVLLLAVMLCVTVPAFAQQAPSPPTPAALTLTRQAFQTLMLGMMRDQVSKLVGSQGPMDLNQEVWGRWVPGAKPGHVEILRVHFYNNQVFWIEYDAFGDSWAREEKGGCSGWVKPLMRRLKDNFDINLIK